MRLILIILALTCISSTASASNLFIRVIDTGPGLAIAGKTPNGYYFIFDVGDHRYSNSYIPGATIKAFQEVIPRGSDVEAVFISHVDSDHMGALPEVMKQYNVKAVYRTGHIRTENKTIWQEGIDAIADAKLRNPSIKDLTLANGDFAPGSRFIIDGVSFTIMSGFTYPPKIWAIKKSDGSNYRNAGSIVLKVSFSGRNILLMGDAAGRIDIDDDEIPNEDDHWAAEKYMLDFEREPHMSVKAEILVAGHHCANDTNSTKFLQAVKPDYVICSSGHAHAHPRAAAIKRVLASGVKEAHILRTDKGDSEPGKCKRENDDICIERYPSKEWHGTDIEVKDPIGDDHIDIIVEEDGHYSAAYAISP